MSFGLRSTTRSLQSLSREMAAVDATAIDHQGMRYFVRHLRDCDGSAYVGAFLSEAAKRWNEQVFLCLVTGDDRAGPCQMTLTGRKEDLEVVGKR